MNKVYIQLKNCFGIRCLEHEFDFSNDNVYSIYARNGLMKTSLAKTFEKIQLKKAKEIADVIFQEVGTAQIKVDGATMSNADVFVIKSLDTSYESDVSSLLVDSNIKTKLKDALKARDIFLKAIEKLSGIKIKKTINGKTIFELERTLIRDFGYSEDSVLVNAENLSKETFDMSFADVQYSVIFDPSVIRKIESKEFQNGIQKFIEETGRVYESFEFLEKGNLTLPKLKDIKKSLSKDSFFVKKNAIYLTGIKNITNESELELRIVEIETAIKKLPELKIIEDMLTDAKGIALKDTIETNPTIVPYLMKDMLNELRKILWISYISVNKSLFDDMLNKYKGLSAAIDKISLDDTPWKKALDIFNERFSVPFTMKITNLKSAIIGESIPHVEFVFSKENDKVQINRNQLNELNTLSQGEKRALYLLNIIFDLEQLKKSGREILLVIDDIADSFDYKNKYAIIEYLYELSENEKIKILLLSHNYDFYRTVSSRLSIPRNHRLFAEISSDGIDFIQEKYQNQPFKYWKNNPCKKFVLAMIPFVRNLVEYGNDKNISNKGKDFDFLTLLLHEENNTNNITFSDLLPIFHEYIGIELFNSDINLTDKVIDILYQECENITPADSRLENKIILAIAIRHIAEKYMKQILSKCTDMLTWNKGKASGTSADFFSYVESHSNQTRELMNGFIQIGNPEAIKVLSEVNIMTPENIHFNSFMYEPILDMDITELLNLYQKVKKL